MDVLRFIYRNSISEYTTIMPETAIGLGMGSSVIGGTATSTALFHSNENVKKDATAVAIMAMLPASAFIGATGVYSADLADTEAYIQSLSQQELQELSDKLSLVNETEEGIIEELQNQNIAEFSKTYGEIEDEVVQKTKKLSIWDK